VCQGAPGESSVPGRTVPTCRSGVCEVACTVAWAVQSCVFPAVVPNCEALCFMAGPYVAASVLKWPCLLCQQAHISHRTRPGTTGIGSFGSWARVVLGSRTTLSMLVLVVV